MSTTKLRHVEKALIKYNKQFNNGEISPFICITNAEDKMGIVPIIEVSIQSDPISLVGVNGIQATDLLGYVKCLFETLNDAFPCRENALTITKIEEAIHWQDHRTKDRLIRKVEGKNED